MNILIVTALLLLKLVPVAAQTDLLPGRIPINEVIRQELAMGSIPEDSSLYSNPPDFYRQPIVFKRTTGTFKPYATVKYHFSRLDSLPFRIEYAWDANGDLGENQRDDATLRVVEPPGRLAEYEAMYMSLRSEFIRLYGKRKSWLTPGGPEPPPSWQWEKWEGAGTKVDLQMFFSVDTSEGGTYRIAVDQQWD